MPKTEIPPSRPSPVRTPGHIFVDLDGVLVNFDKHREEAGVKQDHHPFDWKTLHKTFPTLYRDADAMPDAQHLWNTLSVRYGTPKILTAIPSKFPWPHAKEHKEEWCRKNLGGNPEFRIGPYAVDKQSHCTGPNDVLIDDRGINIKQWRAKGGIGILHTSAEKTLEEMQRIFGA